MKSRIAGLLATAALVLPVPTIVSITPAIGPVCGEQTVIVEGTGFYGRTADYAVEIDGVALTDLVRLSSTQLQGKTVMRSAIGAALDVVVTTQAGSDTLVGGYEFEHSPLTLTACTPATGPETQAVTLTGTGFLKVTEVYDANGFAIGAGFVIVNDRTITTEHQAEGPTAPYAGGFSVEDNIPPELVGPILFDVLPTPSIFFINPVFGDVAGGTPVDITGSGFVDGCTVTVDGVLCPTVTFNDVGSLSVICPPGPAGALDIVVTNPSGLFGTAAGVITYA